MQINQAALEALFYTFDARFAAAYEQAALWSGAVTTEVPSTTRENRYHWLAQIPRLREWVGERVVHNVANRSYSLINKDWEDTIALDRNDIEDETFSSFSLSVDMLGQQAKKWPDDVMAATLQAGTSALAFDGQPFFDDSHPVNIDDPSLSVYANSFGSKTLSHTNYDAVRTAMMSYKDEDGHSLRIMPNLLIVPPQLEKTARLILNADLIGEVYGSNTAAAAQTNVLKGSANLLVVPELSNEADVWYLADVSKPVKPLIFQRRKSPVLTSLTAPNDPNVFYQKKFIYGVDARGAGGYSLPFLIARAQTAALS